MKLDIESFKVLRCIVDTGSFVKAAEKLSKAQSNISYKIDRLEQSLGVKLFDRSAYRVELTAAGRAILHEGDRLLRQVGHIEYLAQRYQAGWEPNLTVVIDGALAMEPIMNALNTIVVQNIPTKIQLKVEFLGGVQERFCRDAAHLMLVKEYQALPGLISEDLPVINNILVSSNSHPLAANTSITRDQLLDYVELTVKDSAREGQSIDVHQFGADRVFYLSSFSDKKQALLKGLGYGWIPEFLIRKELLNGSLVPIRYAGGYTYEFTPKLVYSDKRPLGQAGRSLKGALLDEFYRSLQ